MLLNTFQRLIKLVTLLTFKLLIVYNTISTAQGKPIYFLSELILDWGLAYKYGTDCSLISQHSKVLDKTKIIQILKDNFFISYFCNILNWIICSVCAYSVAQSCSTLYEPIDYRPPALLSMEFSRQEYWRGCHFLLQGIFLTQGWNLSLLHWQADYLPLHHLGSPIYDVICFIVSVRNFERWERKRERW